jgi:hypothetical protein
MDKSLFKLRDYGVFTFISTSQALKAERVLKEAAADFLMMPTPRDISTSCGLAVKIAEQDLDICYQSLLNHQVRVDGAYLVKTIAGKTSVERVQHG